MENNQTNQINQFNQYDQQNQDEQNNHKKTLILSIIGILVLIIEKNIHEIVVNMYTSINYCCCWCIICNVYFYWYRY